MADHMSASELRASYHKGGSLPDDALSAAELRARAGLKSNRRNFSTGEGQEGGSGLSTQTILLLSAGMGILAIITAYMLGYIVESSAGK